MFYFRRYQGSVLPQSSIDIVKDEPIEWEQRPDWHQRPVWQHGQQQAKEEESEEDIFGRLLAKRLKRVPKDKMSQCYIRILQTIEEFVQDDKK